MSGKKYTKEFIDDIVNSEIKEKLKKDGKPELELPSHKWINENGYSAIHRAARREYGMSTHEMLVEHYGFRDDDNLDYDWPGNHSETQRKLDNYIDDVVNHQKLAETTRESRRSRLSTILDYVHKITGDGDLMCLARGSERSGFAILERVFEVIDDYYQSGQSKINYATDLREFYEYCARRGEIDYNPADGLLDEFGWERETDSKTEALSADQIRRMWYEADSLREQALLALMGGAGARPSDIIRIDVPQDIDIDNNPSIEYRERKNGPGEVAIMGGKKAIEYYINQLRNEDNWNGKVFPSDTQSGSRTDQTLRHWVKDIANRANVSLSDESTPTPKNLRRFWYTFYHSANAELHRTLEIVAEDQASSSIDVIENSYLDDDKKKDFIRQYARDKFTSAFPEDGIEYDGDTSDDGRQTELKKFE
ncbi:tyrosine-type recombinase/integrase [Halorutilales archaeon Cl-col2-1]